MYTDGLVERRRLAVTRSIDVLVDTVRGATSAEEACMFAVSGWCPMRACATTSRSSRFRTRWCRRSCICAWVLDLSDADYLDSVGI
jgi:hypothetical protein